MLKRTFKYTDLDDQVREEDVYFHLTKTELLEISMNYPGGFSAWIRKITNSRDGKEIMNVLRTIILKAYGEKSTDGRRFIKSSELSEAFSQTPMYDELFCELALDDKKMAEFINAITPDSNADRGAITNFTPGPLPTQATVLPSNLELVEQ